MTVETATYVSQLNYQIPNATDEVSQGDDHIRLIKETLTTTLPRFDATLQFSADQLNRLHKYLFQTETDDPDTTVENFTVDSKATFNDIVEFAAPASADDPYTGIITGLADIEFTTPETEDPDIIERDKLSRALNLGTADARYVLAATTGDISDNITKLVFEEVVVAETSEKTLTISDNLVAKRVETGELVTTDKIKTTSIELSGDLRVTGSIFRGSDAKLKKDIEALPSEITVDALRPVTYTKKLTGSKEFGLIAQELEDKEGYEHLLSTNDEGYLMVDYVQLIPVLVKEIQDLKKRIQDGD